MLYLSISSNILQGRCSTQQPGESFMINDAARKQIQISPLCSTIVLPNSALVYFLLLKSFDATQLIIA
jgi:hypothetical protein